MTSGEHAHHLGAPAHPATGDRRRLVAALALIVGLMGAEVVAGALSGSLALLSDAAHMLTDAGAVALALVALHLAAQPPQGGLTFGLRRAEVLSALTNGVTLAVLAAWIVFEAVHRLVSAPAVNPRPVLAVALAGAAVNLLATWQLSLADRGSMNIAGSFQHVVTDLYAFIATAVAAVVILATGWRRADAAASLLIAALMLRGAYGLVHIAGRALLEAAPRGMNPDEIGRAIAAVPLVSSLHDLHVWEITSAFVALSAHVLVRREEDCHAVRREIEGMLVERFGIEHTTLQVDHEPERPMFPLAALREAHRPPPR